MNKKFIVPLAIIALSAVVFSFMYQQGTWAQPSTQRVSYIPAEINDVLANPYMGFAVDAKNLKSQQPFKLVYANLRWRELEPEKGNYAWDAIEKTINMQHWRDRHVKLIFRVILDYPGEQTHMDIPDWLYEEINHQGTWYDLSYGKGFSPDYKNAALIQNHQRLIEALGQRYDQDPFVAFVQLGSVGHWGEWHTMNEGDEPIVFPSQAITDQYVEHYLNAFPHKYLMMRRPHEIAKKNNMGLFNDAFGKREQTISGFLNWYVNGYTSWLTKSFEPAMPDFWTKAPSGGEFSPGSIKYVSNETIEDTIVQAKLTHVSWMGPSAPYNEKFGGPLQNNIDRFLKTIGYRFVIAKESHEKEAYAGDPLHIRMTVINRGVAPFYFAWPFELSLANADGMIVQTMTTDMDIKSWLPGEHEATASLPIPANIAAGTYTVLASILDPETGQPGIVFANDGKRKDGRYKLGNVSIQTKKR